MYFNNYDSAVKSYEESKSFAWPPAGEYVCVIAGAKDTPADEGKSFLNVTFKVEEGEHEGKKFSNRYYYGNEIGAGKLIGLARDCGLAPSAKFDENTLSGKKVVVKVKDWVGKTGEVRQEVHFTKAFDPNAVAPNQQVEGVPFA
jgi:hypothetical protein